MAGRYRQDVGVKHALLLVSFGGPEAPDDVVPFLANVTRGRGIPPERLAEGGRPYLDAFGGGSPIDAQCRALAAALPGARGRPAFSGDPQLPPVPPPPPPP